MVKDSDQYLVVNNRQRTSAAPRPDRPWKKSHASPRRLAGSEVSSQLARAFEFRRILVQVDFSRQSAKPLCYASYLAQEHGGKIALLHVTKPLRCCVDAGYGTVNRQIPDEQQTRRDRSRLRRYAAKHLREDRLDHVLIRNGEAAEEIVRAARDLKADLIVLCSHQEMGTDSPGSPNTMERVSRNAPCPVLVVRQHEHDFVHSRKPG